jgi:hypothetical protein
MAVTAVGTAGAGAAVPRAFYGVVPNTALNAGDFSRMGQAHVGSMRVTISWSEVQTSPNGPIDFHAIDQVFGLAAQQHIQLLATITTSPAFETNGCTTQYCLRHIQIGSAANRTAWQSFVKAVAQRYGKGGTFWQQFPQLPQDPLQNYQIWNEVSNPNQKNSSKTYAKLLKLTDSALQSVDPSGKIVLSGMFATPPGGIPAWGYLKQLYRHGAKSHFEEAALHPYPLKPDDVSSPIEKMRAAMKTAHDASTPLLISELGWGSSKKRHPGTGGRGAAFNVGVKKQKAYLKSSFKILTSHRKSWKIGGVDWFSWKDPQNPPDGLCAFCYSSGLYKGDGTTAKPSLAAFEQFASKAH